MKPDPDSRDRLLGEVFHDDWATGRTSTFALEAAALVRRRRHLRTLLLAASAVTTAFILLSIFAPQHTAPQNPPVVAEVMPQEDEITPEEMFALMPERSALLVADASGRRKLYWLDEID